MIYAISDIHGCYEKYKKILKTVRFCKNDTLYVLGDVIDRGDGGIKILLDMMARENVRFIMGNHEQAVLKMLDLLVLYPSDILLKTYPEDYILWMLNGGDATMDAFTALSSLKKDKIVSYLEKAPAREQITVGERKFHLSHTLPKYNPDMSLCDIPSDEFLTGEPDYGVRYAEDMYFVTGHTPTAFIDADSGGRIYRKNNHIAIDCGAVFGSPLGCICLDTLEEFYAD